MLHDPSHYEPPPIAEEIQLAPQDTDVLRRLAAEVAEIAALPVHTRRPGCGRSSTIWSRCGRWSGSTRSPWHEMNVDGRVDAGRPSIPGRGTRSGNCGGRSTSGGICRAT